MKATEILSFEHRVIERVLSALETGAWLLAQQANLRPDFFLEATDFIQGFADGCHHKKEEGVLFVTMVENGMPQENSPVAVMLHEHEMARSYTRALRAAAERLKAGDPTARPNVIYNARHYATLLRNHIGMEDQILFPIADRLIPQSQHDAVWQGFEHVEHEETGQGVHDRYLALAGALELEIFGKDEKSYDHTTDLSDLHRPVLIFDND
jgi:hemerythrin-like domain-containing protein